MIEANKKAENENKVKDGAMVLEKIQYIHYPFCYQKNFTDVEPLLDWAVRLTL